MSSSKKPFQGICFTISGIYDQQRTNICKRLIKLGGDVRFELLKDTQVLIIGDNLTRTRKYKYAVRYRPDIIIIDWKVILELYELWKEGEDITYQNKFDDDFLRNNQQLRMLFILRNDHSDLPLSNFYIFIGRIEPVSSSSSLLYSSSQHNYSIPDLEKICKALGCKYVDSKSLDTSILSKRDTRDIVFISGEQTGTRLRAAERFNIPIVHYKWLIDCNKRNAILEYNPHYLLENLPDDISFDDIGVESCNCWEMLDKINELDALNNEGHTHLGQEDRSKSDEPSLLLNKFKPEGSKIWKRTMSPHKSAESQLNKDILLDSMTLHQEKKPQLQEDKYNRLIFNDSSFIVHSSFPPRHHRILLNILKKNGGTIITSSHTDPDYLIVPSSIPLETLNLPFSSSSIYVVTEFFIERCLHYKTLINPPDSWSKPFFATENFHLIPNQNILHDPSSKELTIAITGFQGVELLHLTKILKLLDGKGVRYSQYVNKHIDILLVNIAALPLISQDYGVWKNEYSDLFLLNKEQLRNDRDNQATVFRNSLKRKLTFVKQIGTIPVLTPAIIMDIFRKTKHFINTENSPNRSININDTDWCIVCPKNKSSFYEIVIKRTLSCPPEEKLITSPVKDVNEKTTSTSPSRNYKISKTIYDSMNSSTHSSAHTSQRSIRGSFKTTAKEVMAKFQEPARASHVKRKTADPPILLKLDNVPNLSRGSSKLDTNIEVHDFSAKRPKIEANTVKTVERSSSWGTMMSMGELNPTKEPVPDTSSPTSGKEDNIMHTQVLYGNDSDRTRSSPLKHRPLTRNQAKQFDI